MVEPVPRKDIRIGRQLSAISSLCCGGYFQAGIGAVGALVVVLFPGAFEVVLFPRLLTKTGNQGDEAFAGRVFYISKSGSGSGSKEGLSNIAI